MAGLLSLVGGGWVDGWVEEFSGRLVAGWVGSWVVGLRSLMGSWVFELSGRWVAGWVG